MIPFHLSTEDKSYLLILARTAIFSKIEGKEFQKKPYHSPSLEQTSGVFVTLNKNHQLRGCIGYVEGIKPLNKAVEEMAIAAAIEDPRLPPLEKEEVEDLDIEISVLSPLEIITNMEDIEIGTHGIIIEQGYQRGLLLPQVAVEYNWDTTTFLEQTCYKAGLPADAWQNDSTTIQIFSAEFFSEADFKS